jgi:hypothetical protein
MGFNGFICDGCCCLVDFAADGEAGVCATCCQFDLGDGNCYCLECAQEKTWAHCDGCGEFLCHDCYQESHTCIDCEQMNKRAEETETTVKKDDDEDEDEDEDEDDEDDEDEEEEDEEEEYEDVANITLPQGEYFIGDPCYVIPDDIWDEWCTTLKMKDGEVMTNGIKWVINSTHWGDGLYEGSDGYAYGVDAGTLGMVPAALFDPWKKESAGMTLGTFHTFDTEITYRVSRGKNVTIFTISSGSFNLEIRT